MDTGGDVPGRLSRFIARLADKHTDPDVVFVLRMAQAGLAALGQPAAPVPALAVIGPTQTGKSTVVNVIAGADCVEVSPLAAHTRQAAILAMNSGQDGVALLPVIEGLATDCLPVSSDGPPCLVCDTPDFDSNASAIYRQQVAQVCALADLVVVVLSKEKYADQSVWTVLEAIAPLEIPAVVCLNKCEGEAASETAGTGTGRAASDADVLVPAIRRRLEENPRVSPEVPVFTLPLVAGGDTGMLLERSDVQVFRRAVFGQLALRSRADRRAAMSRLLRRHWTAWVAPVEEELACRREWEGMIEAATVSFVERYRSEYIDHARHHDVARKAILGLLELLEIPVLAGAMSRTRRVLTWPFHKVSTLLGRAGEPGRDQELKVLGSALDHYLLSLRGEILGRRHPWWRGLAEELTRREAPLKRDFRSSVVDYRRAFEPRIEKLSEDLYARLRRNPVGLNALRATRAAADAGGIVLAMKTGTVGLYDALLAPAVISLTSYLTESAVGQYLRTVIGRMKREQLDQVAAIVRDTLEQPLGKLQPRGGELYGITEDELVLAGRQLEELRR